MSLNRGSIKTNILSPFSKHGGATPVFYDALTDVSLTVRDGERLGIIGRNGAGKSSILRTIAGIYPLVSGDITLNGVVRSLFDIGTGFEIEESGRDNIYYRGYLLGYTHKEICNLEQEIIEFADLSEFIDFPFKTYSSGMKVRLAFAISTAMGGSILLIDEILAAGDSAFTQKAYDRMRKLIDHAACIVFVSHNMRAIENLCTRVIWVDNGKIVADGTPKEVISKYIT